MTMAPTMAVYDEKPKAKNSNENMKKNNNIKKESNRIKNNEEV